MPRKTHTKIYLCGGDYGRLDPRAECPNALHDWPLPAGYTDSFEVAEARLRNRWSNRRCPDCGRYGWAPGRKTDATNAIQVPVPDG
jgi:hypothetical protein